MLLAPLLQLPFRVKLLTQATHDFAAGWVAAAAAAAVFWLLLVVVAGICQLLLLLPDVPSVLPIPLLVGGRS